MTGKLLYKPSDPQSSETHKFREVINKQYNLNLKTYEELWRWSTTNVGEFWNAVWDYTEVIGDKSKVKEVVDPNARPGDNPAWFEGATLNWAENLLKHRSDKVALIQATEPYPGNEKPAYRNLTYAQLYEATKHATSALLSYGVGPGDRVASYSTNCIENIVASLASTAIGAIWVSAASDFGPEGVLERFEQVGPKVIFSVDSVAYNGKLHDHIPKLKTLLSGLEQKSLSPSKIVVIPFSETSETQSSWDSSWLTWSSFLSSGSNQSLGRKSNGDISFHQTSFNHPLWILFSSGTTGKPKPLVHRAGGMLLQAKKEFVIAADMKKDDVFFYYTTTGWMMWNWLVHGFSVGATLVLYDGSPLKDPSILWRFVDELGITIFGTSAKYIEQLSKNYQPSAKHSLKTLRHIYSTGSPLSPEGFDFVYEQIKSDVLLASITGGTDICSLFAGMCTELPVFRGEIQCRMLGMAIDAYDSSGQGRAVDRGVSGELVCTKPFPCQPLGFWPLNGFGPQDAVDTAEARHQASYFGVVPGIWYHGDHVIISESKDGNGGGLIMLGRSDGVLNPGGIRFGSAEIYQVLESCFGEQQGLGPELTILDSLVVGQSINRGSDERVILFVKLKEGIELGPELVKRIAGEIRSRRTARHVPAKCLQVRDVPHTLNGKKVEVPVRKIINGAAVESINASTLRNPECLEEYVALGLQLRGEAGV